MVKAAAVNSRAQMASYRVAYRIVQCKKTLLTITEPALMKKVVPDLQWTQCVIHREAQASRQLSLNKTRF